MASFEPTSPEIFTRDVLAFSDAELVQFVERSRRPDGNFEPDVADWDTLPKDQREKLAERLKFGARKAADTAPSYSVDLDQVTARLLEATTDKPESAPRRFIRHRTETPPGIDEYREVEKVHYHALVNVGGRPCYPIALLQDVSENPKEYCTMLRPWQRHPDTSWPSWEVFGTQLRRWEDFCVWQLVNRDIYDPDSAYVAFVEKQKRISVAEGETEDDSSRLLWLWDHVERARSHDYPRLYWLEKPKPTGAEEGDTKEPATSDTDHYFHDYVEQVKRRLALHGFTRTFQLEKDPKRQDKLTTWIEYLNYEYSWYDRYARSVKRLQPQHDEIWKKLADSGVLETEEDLLADGSALQRHSEWLAARRALQAAKEAAKAALAETEKAKQGRSRVSTAERKRRLIRAHSQVNSAKKTWEVANRRANLIRESITGTHDYRGAKHDVYRQGVLVQWILEQVPLIEAELSEDNELESEPSPVSAPSLRVARRASLPRPAKDTSRQTRSGRIAKNAAQSRRGTQLRHAEPTRAEALPQAPLLLGRALQSPSRLRVPPSLCLDLPRRPRPLPSG